MREFCISASVMGTDRHLLTDGTSSFVFKDSVPANTLTLSREADSLSDTCLNTLFRLSNTNINTNPPEQYVKMMASLTKKQCVPWSKVMPSAAHRSFVKGLVSQVVDNSNKLPVTFYERVWRPGTTVLRSLVRPRVDVDLITELLAAHVGNQHVVKTFLPEEDGRARAITYNRFGTLTGRYTVEKGPGILTLKREYKRLIKPEDGHKLVSIDFAALEARVVLYEAGKSCNDRDIYGSIAAELNYDRDLVKGAVISELYGIGKEQLSHRLKIYGDELDTFVSRVKQHFSTRDLLKRVKEGFIRDGFITNRYGRRVIVDEPLNHVFMNYYAQSTGADVASLGFAVLLELFNAKGLGCIPYYVLHDAMIISVPERSLDAVMGTTQVRVPGYVQPFFLKSDVIG